MIAWDISRDTRATTAVVCKSCKNKYEMTVGYKSKYFLSVFYQAVWPIYVCNFGYDFRLMIDANEVSIDEATST
jgi:hypothetical protein